MYNNIPLYNEGAIENAELVKEIYPGWTARFYVDYTVSADVISRLEEKGSEIIYVGADNLGPMYGRYWRFWVAGDEDVERFIVRERLIPLFQVAQNLVLDLGRASARAHRGVG